METFGKLTDGTGTQSFGADYKAASSATPSSNGTVTSLTARAWLSGAGTINAKGIIYADDTGAPGALLAVSDEVALTNTSEQEVNFTFSGANQISIVSGTLYWIGLHFDSTGSPNFVFSTDSTSNGHVNSIDEYSDGPTDPFGSPTNRLGIIDCYVTYTPSAAPDLKINIAGYTGVRVF